jgi:hypothetical protein
MLTNSHAPQNVTLSSSFPDGERFSSKYGEGFKVTSNIKTIKLSVIVSYTEQKEPG